MANSELTPTVFLSYSWSPVKNKIWVLELAERLMQDGVRVVLDEWDAHEGQDKYVFMEQMVRNPDINYVLLICTKTYSEKANSRRGGVGVESQIVSSKIYADVEQKKFIPIVRERSSDGKEYLPTFLDSRFYIDLCEGESYEENYEHLLRRIFEKPKNRRPSLGSPPAYILEDAPVFLRTAHLMRPLKLSIQEGSNKMDGLISSYFEEFLLTLEDFEIILPQNSGDDIDDLVVKHFESLRVLRDEYVDFLRLYLKYKRGNKEQVHDFFEKLAAKLMIGRGTRLEDCRAHIHLLARELFIYTIALLTEYKEYGIAGYIFSTDFVVDDTNGNISYLGFAPLFNRYVEEIDTNRNKRLQLRKFSLSAALIKDRCTLKGLGIDIIAKTDIMLHYASLLNPNFNRNSWLPRMTPYRTTWSKPRLVQLMKSQAQFEKIKHFWMVDTKEELISRVSSLDLRDLYHSNAYWNYNITEINDAFREDEICSLN